MRRRIYSGAKWEESAGYCRAIVLPDPHGDWVMVSGTTGFDYAADTISDDPAEQAHQCFRTIGKALAEAGSGLGDIYRIRAFLSDIKDFPAVSEVIGEHMRLVRPVNTSVIAGFVDPRIRVEIEVEARKPAPDPQG